MSDGGATSSSVGLNFAQYLFSILMLYGSYLSAIFSVSSVWFISMVMHRKWWTA